MLKYWPVLLCLTLDSTKDESEEVADSLPGFFP